MVTEEITVHLKLDSTKFLMQNNSIVAISAISRHNYFQAHWSNVWISIRNSKKDMYPSQLVMVQGGQHFLKIEQVQAPLLVDSVVVAVKEN